MSAPDPVALEVARLAPTLPQWRVTGQRPWQEHDGQGRTVNGTLVAFTYGEGKTGSVFLRPEEMPADRVRARIVLWLYAASARG